jgi:hypothetical protein
MMWILVTFTVRAQDREPTEEELRQSTIQMRQVFTSARTLPPLDKLWEGTQHLMDDDGVDLGSVVTVELTPTKRQETWLAEPSTALGFGPAFLAEQQALPSSVAQETEALGPGLYQKAVMTVEYKDLTQASVQAMQGAFLPGARKLYEVAQVLEPSGQDGHCEAAWEGGPQGWLLRVKVGTNSWQDHWLFLDSLQWEAQDGVLPELCVRPASAIFDPNFSVRTFYSWAVGEGADSWSFVEYDVLTINNE